MLGASDAVEGLVRGREQRRTIAVAIALALSLGARATDAQAPAISPTGSMGGLEAKFIDVRGVKTRYYEMGQGETIVLLHFLQAKNATAVHVVGQSMGGMAAFYFTVAHPEMVKTMIIVNSASLVLYDLIGAKTPNVRMLISQGGGHFPYRIHPEEFNRQIIDFIDFWSVR